MTPELVTTWCTDWEKEVATLAPRVPSTVTAFMSAATKTAALVVTMRVLVTAFPEQEEFWTIGFAAIVWIELVLDASPQVLFMVLAAYTVLTLALMEKFRANYLPRPLKTEIFRQKLELAAAV